MYHLVRSMVTILMLLTPILIAAGCANHTERADSHVHYVQIRDTITPMDLYVSVGDQVRWQNLRGGHAAGRAR